MSGFEKAIWNEKFALHNTRSESLAIGTESVFLPVDLILRVSGMLAIVVIDQTRGDG